MNKLSRNLFVLAFGLLILFVAALYLPSAKAILIRHSGAVIPQGSGTLVFTNKPFRLLKVTGDRWVDGRPLKGTAYHVLVIFPVVIPEDKSSSSGGDGFSHYDVQKWLVPTGGGSADSQSFAEKELAINYDAVWLTIAVGGRTYHLAQGNLFIIRFDQNWQSAVTQLNLTMNTDSSYQEEIDAFKSALKDDPMVRQLD